MIGEEIMVVLNDLNKGERGKLITVTHNSDVSEKMDKVYRLRYGVIESVS
jgi:ABC-type lipoprotein export system ATPase subunit